MPMVQSFIKCGSNFDLFDVTISLSTRSSCTTIQNDQSSMFWSHVLIARTLLHPISLKIHGLFTWKCRCVILAQCRGGSSVSTLLGPLHRLS
ncbi:hypothetical protein J6590_067524 [Homalodisca vitripennis]|nr:hypothetical protein J6590_067524 [Homalodisca vitripennis]